MNKKKNIYRNILILNQLERIVKECKNLNIDICLLKGTALILSNIYNIWEREMEDVDILIRESDLKKFKYLMSNMDYKKVNSGEDGFYKDRENAMIDIHTDILYLDKKQNQNIFKEMKQIKGFKVMCKEDHLLYILHHGLIQHGNAGKKWKEDIIKLIENGISWKKLKNKLNTYALNEVFYVAMKQLDIPVSYIKHNSLKRK